MINDFPAMDAAFVEARQARDRGEVPVGAVIVNPSGQIVARAGNRVLELHDPTAHAEILVLREACQLLGSDRLPGHDLYVTLEPCAMCAAAISYARIRRLYFGASDPKSGGLSTGPRLYSQPTLHHKPDVYSGICEADAAALMTDFFRVRRG